MGRIPPHSEKLGARGGSSAPGCFRPVESFGMQEPHKSGPPRRAGKQRSCGIRNLEECTEDGRRGTPAKFLADTFLEQLVNHNGDPPPCFSKAIDSKGTLSCFRINTFRSVDSAWFIGVLSLDKSNT